MPLKLKGLMKIKKTLATGKTIYYCYAWRGGPLLKAKTGAPMQPGDSMLAHAFAEAKAVRHYAPTDDLEMIVREFRQSAEFRLLRPETRENYLHYFDDIRSRFGALSLVELQQPSQRGEFKRWRDSMSDRPRTADYAWATLARVLSFAKDRGFISTNVCERGGRLYAADRADKIWTDEDIAAFRKVASNELAFALDLALWTGQRQRDLLQLMWTQYDGKTLKIKQSKTGARVVIPVAQALRATMDSKPRTCSTILTTTRGASWTADGFRSSWGKACREAGVKGLSFHDLRGTTVTRLALAGCGIPEIAAITGHSSRDVGTILDAHYLGGQREMAAQAMAKWESVRPG